MGIEFRIDNTQVLSDETIELSFEGWCFDEQNLSISLDIEIDGKNLESKTEWITRTDVASVYGQQEYIENSGFKIWTQIDSTADFKELRLIAKTNENTITLQKILKKELEKYLPKQTLEGHIDIQSINNNVLYIEGWAFSRIDSDIKFEVTDSAGTPVEHIFKVMDRVDVNKIFGFDKEKQCGFKFIIDVVKDAKYCLKIRDQYSESTHYIDTKQLIKEANKQIKKGKGLGLYLKQFSLRRLSSDYKYIKENGWKKYQIFLQMRNQQKIDYGLWHEIYMRPKQKDIDFQRNRKFMFSPKISIIVPAYKTPVNFLREMIESVIDQTYGNWELCIADGSADASSISEVLNEYQKKDRRIKYVTLDENLGISGNTNAALELAAGDFIGLLDHDDILPVNALYEVVNEINKDQEIEILYTDEDKISMDSSLHFEPHFKSDFNIDLLRSNNYICHFFVVKKDIVDKAGEFRSEFDGSQDYDFILRCIEQSHKIKHIPKVLYHWRSHQNSTAVNPESKMYCFDAGQKAIQKHLERCGIDGTVEKLEYLGFYKVKYAVPEAPLVSIIIPNKDNAEVLKKCVKSIKDRSSYRNYEILIVENNSGEDKTFEYYSELSKDESIRILYWKEGFNYSKINNFAVEQSKGEYILLLNNDTEIITEDWIEQMLSNSMRPEVGIVGAKLSYPDDTIQHAGVIMGVGGIAGHAFVNFDINDPGYFARASIQQNLSGVTAACLMISRKIYDEVDGLEEDLQVAFNDVDLCLKVREKGYLIVYNPEVLLYHYESKSRGGEDTAEKYSRFREENEYMDKKWKEILKEGDPYYNKNLNLSIADYTLRG